MYSLSRRPIKDLNWSTLILAILGFWLSASCLIDLLILPSLSAAGMMSQTGFASAGFLLFGIFNRIELVCASLVLSGFLVFRRHHTLSHLKENWSIAFASLLFVIPLCYTYFLTPQMGALGLQLNLFTSFNPMSSAMMAFHSGYWLLEGLKLFTGVMLMRWCYQSLVSLDHAA